MKLFVVAAFGILLVACKPPENSAEAAAKRPGGFMTREYWAGVYLWQDQTNERAPNDSRLLELKQNGQFELQNIPGLISKPSEADVDHSKPDDVTAQATGTWELGDDGEGSLETRLRIENADGHPVVNTIRLRNSNEPSVRLYGNIGTIRGTSMFVRSNPR